MIDMGRRVALGSGMDLQGKKLGILVSAAPESAGFHHALKLAETALSRGVDVYFYCIDEAVSGLGQEPLLRLRIQGLKLHGCAYGMQRRGLALEGNVVYGGLSIVSDLMAATDRFLCFN